MGVQTSQEQPQNPHTETYTDRHQNRYLGQIRGARQKDGEEERGGGRYLVVDVVQFCPLFEEDAGVRVDEASSSSSAHVGRSGGLLCVLKVLQKLAICRVFEQSLEIDEGLVEGAVYVSPYVDDKTRIAERMSGRSSQLFF